MKLTNIDIINSVTDIDDMTPAQLTLFTPEEIFHMGQFYQWAEPLVSNDNLDLNDTTDVPDEFAWVVGETQSW